MADESRRARAPADKLSAELEALGSSPGASAVRSLPAAVSQSFDAASAEAGSLVQRGLRAREGVISLTKARLLTLDAQRLALLSDSGKLNDFLSRPLDDYTGEAAARAATAVARARDEVLAAPQVQAARTALAPLGPPLTSALRAALKAVTRFAVGALRVLARTQKILSPYVVRAVRELGATLEGAFGELWLFLRTDVAPSIESEAKATAAQAGTALSEIGQAAAERARAAAASAAAEAAATSARVAAEARDAAARNAAIATATLQRTADEQARKLAGDALVDGAERGAADAWTTAEPALRSAADATARAVGWAGATAAERATDVYVQTVEPRLGEARAELVREGASLAELARARAARLADDAAAAAERGAAEVKRAFVEGRLREAAVLEPLLSDSAEFTTPIDEIADLE
ncbi:hypothetical protein KFE25_003593 [Diacronema lutheri]|uniref:Uncharacterized protein n=1 Tax=Diacronema lutheri TaxID=2081491 RepID=A0A8J5XBE9_DIALT|nr:hypothetical protein KFE25_003593 [Diacronema lutheri]